MTSIIQRMRKIIQIHWSQKINGKSGIQISSIICSHSLELMEFSLSHVVQENDKPDANGDFPNFMDKMITCAPLMGD